MAILHPAKPLAALNSALLARKGQARPAMRPQGFSSMTGSPAPLDDLGWNDMGASEGRSNDAGLNEGGSSDGDETVPPVLVEREVLAREVAQPVDNSPVVAEPASEPEPMPVLPGISMATAARIGRESAGQTRKGKAAFTLRLEAGRHLRLRLASAVAHRSAQTIVADALDRFLQTMPEVEALAAQLPQTKATR